MVVVGAADPVDGAERADGLGVVVVGVAGVADGGVAGSAWPGCASGVDLVFAAPASRPGGVCSELVDVLPEELSPRSREEPPPSVVRPFCPATDWPNSSSGTVRTEAAMRKATPPVTRATR